MTNNPLMIVRGLKVHYPIFSGIIKKIVGHVKAVDGVDFTVYNGEVFGIVGETGSGKTTLARALLRLIEPTAGEISFQGQNVLSMDPKALIEFRKKAQIVFQDPYASLNPRKTIRDAIGEGLLYHGLVKNPSQQTERVADVLTMVGLHPDDMMRFPHQLSGGQQQRVCIGRAIAINPQLIVCDEAASALDVSVQAQILNLLQELKESLSLSYIFVSHDLSLIHYLCNHVIVLYLGKVMESAPVKSLFQNPRHPYTQALLSAIPKNSPKEQKNRIILTGEIPSAAAPPSGCPFRTRCPYAQPICAQPPPKKTIMNPETGKFDHEYYCILD